MEKIFEQNLSDRDDYIGCFKKDSKFMVADSLVFEDGISPCLCIGYCRSLNYSVAGAITSSRYMQPTCSCGDNPGVKTDESKGGFQNIRIFIFLFSMPF